ncbi:hypothetical protein AGDE_16750 [Angomonas deanei]|nr:hypothetical protein AGDE_16750 [Angomonas deanei]|eukprot:EPY16285.1 hypothetical protein AGDE_16750 [Angomonas deanei]
MSRREETPFLGYFEFPLLQLITHANGDVSVGDGGSFFYCALNGSRRYVCDASSIKDDEAYVRPTRGGFFCDSVGLGKTLSLIALSAHDRLVGETMKGGRKELATQKKYQTRLWCVPPKEVADHLAGVVKSSTVELFNLPRTTLVVVPMSIVVQWEQEIIKFYPSAKYILYYGTKRFKYTEKDFLEADFVITTYETLSTHLRDETDFMKYGISPDDDPVRVKIAKKFVDLQKYFFKMKHMFPKEYKCTFSYSGYSFPVERGYETICQDSIHYTADRYTYFVRAGDDFNDTFERLLFSASFLDNLYDYYKTSQSGYWVLQQMIKDFLLRSQTFAASLRSSSC